jgi:hypothetical protein
MSHANHSISWVCLKMMDKNQKFIHNLWSFHGLNCRQVACSGSLEVPWGTSFSGWLILIAVKIGNGWQ